MDDQEEAAESPSAWAIEERRRESKRLRLKVGFSQGKLGKLAGIAGGTLSRYEAGRQDLAPKTLKKLEEALSDALAAQRTLALLRIERQNTGLLSEMAPPPTGTEVWWQRREEFIAAGTRRMTELEHEVAGLKEQITELKKTISLLERSLENANQLTNRLEELSVLQGATIEELQKSVPVKSQSTEAQRLLARVRLLAAKGKR